jgi:D-alanyl-D-alanine endopeptidase (penicillin-binding protein 7)
MYDLFLNLILSGIFLRASAGNAIGPSLPANTLPLADKKIEARIPERDFTSQSLGVKVTAKSYIVVEPESGAVLYSKNADQPRSIASITKLMTALVFLENSSDWDAQVTMVASDYKGGSTPVLLIGDKVTDKDLFYAMLVASSNEAASALARSTRLRPEEFILQMNVHAKLLDMENSTFVEPTGLSDGNQASAEDIIKLIKVAFSHSEVRKAATTKTLSIRVPNKNIARTMQSTDQILKEDFGTDNSSYKIEAGKTGFINAAGYCFASQIRDENNRRLLIAVLGSSSTYDRFIDTKSLAYWVFSNYKW